MQVEGLKVFFSYARADSEFALRLAQNMKSAGVDLWIDQLDIPTGARWDQTVEDALKTCPRFLIILSPASIASQNVMDEVAFAIDRHKKILPVLYQKCDIPFRLQRLQYIDFTDDYDTALTKLLLSLSTQSPSPSNEREIFSTKPTILRAIANKRLPIIFTIIALLGAGVWRFAYNGLTTTCPTTFSPNAFQGRTGRVAFFNEWSSPVTVILYHPNNRSIFNRYTVSPGQNNFLDSVIVVGDNWGVCFENKPSSSGVVNSVGTISDYNPNYQGSSLFMIQNPRIR